MIKSKKTYKPDPNYWITGTVITEGVQTRFQNGNIRIEFELLEENGTNTKCLYWSSVVSLEPPKNGDKIAAKGKEQNGGWFVLCQDFLRTTTKEGEML